MALTINDNAPDFEANTTEGPIRFHEWLGNSWGVLFSHPKRFHPGLHDRTRPHGGAEAGIREARRQGDRPFGRSRGKPQEVVDRHCRDARHGAELSDDRRHRPQDFEALRHAARRHGRNVGGPYARRQRHGARRLRRRSRTRRSSWRSSTR